MSDPVRIVVGSGESAEIRVASSSESAEIRIPESGLIVGPPGPAGEDGATFFPEVSEEGVISWTNDGGYDNPEPVNIKGPAGNDGSDGEDGEDGVSPTVSFTTITGGHTMTVTDKDHPSGQSINIMDGESGGGGTTDYDDLTDKPSINGTTLSGNKTTADLGLGTYSKPSGGIPASDLASAVQTSLGKADSALQSVPSTYRTAVAQDAIDAAQNAEIAQIPRPNLLDNWYFVGGGSQLGYGKFPINQRGQGSYLGPGYGVDRWSCATSSVTVLCGYSNYIVLKSSTAGAQNLLIQYIDNKELLAGKTVTISAMINSRLVQSTISIPADSSTWGSTIGSGSNPVGGCAIYLRYLNSKLCFVFYASSTYVANTNILISSAKLELNSYQTLAHNEGTEESPNWVLNEIPDYGEELLKCQKYFQIIPASGTFLTPIGHGIGYDTNQIRVTVPLSTPMVKTPTVTVQNCSFRFYQDSLSAAITTYTAVTATSGSSGNEHLRPYVMLRFTVTGALNAKVAELIIIGDSGSTNPGILLSAED